MEHGSLLGREEEATPVMGEATVAHKEEATGTELDGVPSDWCFDWVWGAMVRNPSSLYQELLEADPIFWGLVAASAHHSPYKLFSPGGYVGAAAAYDSFGLLFLNGQPLDSLSPLHPLSPLVPDFPFLFFPLFFSLLFSLPHPSLHPSRPTCRQLRLACTPTASVLPASFFCASRSLRRPDNPSLYRRPSLRQLGTISTRPLSAIQLFVPTRDTRSYSEQQSRCAESSLATSKLRQLQSLCVVFVFSLHLGCHRRWHVRFRNTNFLGKRAESERRGNKRISDNNL